MTCIGTEFGEAARTARKGKGWYQWEVANMTGTTVSTISQIERGNRRRPRGNLADRIAKVLGIDPPGKVLEASVAAAERAHIEEAVISYLDGDRLRTRTVMDVLDLARQTAEKA